MKLCKVCNKEIKYLGNKYCSLSCAYKDRLNGKQIKCKNCGKEFYKSLSDLQHSKFCSLKCYFDFHRIIKCKKCDQKKEKYQNTNYCFECYIEIQREKESKRKILKRNSTKFIELECKFCKIKFNRPFYYQSKYCSRTCYFLHQKELRKGNKNPNWRGGFNDYDSHHLEECSKYKKSFLKEHDYLFCELCGRSDALRYETHHIVFASEAPRHKELHNKKNLILLCCQCHNNFHSKKILRNNLVEKRELNNLFKRNLIIKSKNKI